MDVRQGQHSLTDRAHALPCCSRTAQYMEEPWRGPQPTEKDESWPLNVEELQKSPPKKSPQRSSKRKDELSPTKMSVLRSSHPQSSSSPLELLASQIYPTSIVLPPIVSPEKKAARNVMSSSQTEVLETPRAFSERTHALGRRERLCTWCVGTLATICRGLDSGRRRRQ